MTPVIAIKFECDFCHKTFKGTEEVAILRNAKVACKKCILSVHPDSVYTWFSPTETVKTTQKPKEAA